jgi:hypothetical protein
VDYQELHRPRLGALATRGGMLDPRQVLEVLAKQSDCKQPFGQVARELGYLSGAQVEELLALQRAQTPPVGDILVAQRSIARDVLEAQLEHLRASGRIDARANL